jgi:hypothetical protein
VVDMRLINPDKLYWFWVAQHMRKHGGYMATFSKSYVRSGIRGDVSPAYTNMTDQQAKAWRGRL